MNPARNILGDSRFVAVDVGAARGLLPHWRQLASFAHLVMVEPDAQAIPGIEVSLRRHRAVDAIVEPAALSEEGGQCTLYRHAIPSGSSLLRVRVPEALDYCDERHLFPVTEVAVETETLRGLLDRLNEPTVDMIKLDTQGTELSILRGLDASRWSRLIAVELEIGMPGAYEGQATFAAVEASMVAHGLELFDIVPKRAPLLRNGGATYSRLFGTYEGAPSVAHRLFEVDAYYLRSAAQVLQSGDARLLHNAIVAYATYGYFAHALRLAEDASRLGTITKAEADGFANDLRRWHRSVAVKRLPFDVAHRVLQKLGDLVPRDDVRRP